MYFVVTIDTEEDQWSDFTRVGHTLNNIYCIPKLQQLFESYWVRPTYLLTYPVVQNSECASYFAELLAQKKVEIGSHCHPWNTPPFYESLSVYNSMLCNLPAELQKRKLKELTTHIEKKIGITPISFRTGRWGYSADVATALMELGYQVETSMTPFVDWRKYQGPDLSASPTDPYYFQPEKPMVKAESGSMLEVPVSIGYNRKSFKLCYYYSTLMSWNKCLQKIFLGSLSRLGLLQKIWLSPELSTAAEMINLIKILSRKKALCLNMMFHSNSLYPGNTPFTRNDYEIELFYAKIEEVLAFVSSLGCMCVTLKELRDNIGSRK